MGWRLDRGYWIAAGSTAWRLSSDPRPVSGFRGGCWFRACKSSDITAALPLPESQTRTLTILRKDSSAGDFKITDSSATITETPPGKSRQALPSLSLIQRRNSSDTGCARNKRSPSPSIPRATTNAVTRATMSTFANSFWSTDYAGGQEARNRLGDSRFC